MIKHRGSDISFRQSQPSAHRALFIPELVTIVLLYLRDADYDAYTTHMLNTQYAFDDVVALDLHAIQAQVTLAHAALTCRSWHPLATDLLYKRAILTTPASLWSFAETICKKSLLAQMVYTIILLDTPQDQTHLIPPLASLASGEPSRIRYQAGVDLIRIVCAAPTLQHLGVHYGREESLFCEIKGDVFTQLSELNDLRKLSIDGTLTCPVLGMALDGVAAHIRGFTQLEELTFNELFCDLRRLDLPRLRRLTIRGCRCQLMSWTIPENAPLLRELTLTDNIVLEPRTESQTRGGLIRIARTLEFLTLKGAAEWNCFRCGDWRPFTRIQRMVVGYSCGTPRLDCRAVSLPPKLQELVVFRPTSRLDIYLGTDEGRLTRALGTDAASPSCWSRVRIDATADLMENPSFGYACKQLQQVYVGHEVDVKICQYDAKQSVEGKPFYFAFRRSPICAIVWTYPVERDHELALKPTSRPLHMTTGTN